MTDASGTVLGIRLRSPDGSKFAVEGGKAGLHIPSGIADRSSLLACEGPTDAAALLDMGFRNVVGRPSCWGAGKLMAGLIRLRSCQEVVIVADGDGPGRRGAESLASELIAHVSSVRVITPPEGTKDARAWAAQGATRDDVEAVIANAPVYRLTIRTTWKGKRHV